MGNSCQELSPDFNVCCGKMILSTFCKLLEQWNIENKQEGYITAFDESTQGAGGGKMKCD